MSNPAPPFRLSPELRRECREHASPLGVTPAVHEADFIFQFILAHPGFPKRGDAVRHYFQDGRRSALRLGSLLTRLGKNGGPGEERTRLLEFASGYGCVTRHLDQALDGVELTACDIHPEAVRFVEQEMNVGALLSRSIPEEFAPPQSFDVVFALSFFSHMPERTWARWLTRLLACLKDDGVLIFTTQGLASRESFGNPEIPENGLWFRTGSEQKDLDGDEYGSAIVTPRFVATEIERAGAMLTLYEAASWWDIQDLYVVRRTPFSAPADTEQPGPQEVEAAEGEPGLKAAMASARARLDEGSVDEALRICQASARRWPDRFWPHFLAGRCLAQLGRRGEARAAYRRALDAQGQHPSAAEARAAIQELRLHDDA